MNQFFANTGRLACLWLCLVALLLGLALRQGAAFDSSIMSLLPKSQQNPLINLAAHSMADSFSTRLVIIFSAQDEAIVQRSVRQAARELSSFGNVVWNTEDTHSMADELFIYRFSVLDEGLRRKLAAGQQIKVKQHALQKIFSPFSKGGSNLRNDPFGLYSELLINQKSQLNLQLVDGLFKLGDSSGADNTAPTYLLIVELNAQAFDIKQHKPLLNALETLEKRLRLQGVEMHKSGMLLHAAAGAEQAEAEISTIGLGSLVGVTLLVLLVFRGPLTLLLMLLPIGVGFASAIAVTILVFDQVHLVTIAFGAGLVGVSIDYALHYLCERRINGSTAVLKKIVVGLIIGLLSSVIAYAALALAPFPGLRQMALFSVVGLVSAWLTVVLCFPTLTRSHYVGPLKAAVSLDNWSNKCVRLGNNAYISIALFIAALAAFFVIAQGQALDDVRLLQTSPTHLLEGEQRVQSRLGLGSSSRFLLVSAESIESVLQKEERLIKGLKQLKSEQALDDFRGVSQVIPSLQRQHINSQMVTTLYADHLDPLFRSVHLSAQQQELARLSMEADIERRLTPEHWRTMQVSEGWRELIIKLEEGSAATAVRLIGPIDDALRERLETLAGSESGVYYVDQVDNITSLLSSFRQQIFNWLLMAYLLVAALLLWRYRAGVWRILLPPLLASLFTFAVVIKIEQGYNLFNLIALILVLGIGLDMGIFLQESEGSSHTWLAVSLSALTSLLAFGLLSLSSTPVLYHFGLTVLLGLSFVWLLVLLMRKNILGARS